LLSLASQATTMLPCDQGLRNRHHGEWQDGHLQDLLPEAAAELLALDIESDRPYR